PSFERAARLALVARQSGKELEREVPFTRNHAVEPLANGVRVDVSDEASEVPAVALTGLAVLAPGNYPGRQCSGEFRPDIHLVHVSLVSGNHALILPYEVGPVAVMRPLVERFDQRRARCSRSSNFRAGATAGQFGPCSQYQP